MKRLLLIAIPLGLVVAGYWFITRNPTAPQYRAIQSFQMPAYTRLHYQFLSPRPFARGKMWLSIYNGTNSGSCYLYDIEHRKVIGELRHAAPVFLNHDESQLLCMWRNPANLSLIEKGRLLVEQQFLGPRFCPWKPKAKNRSGTDDETFWLLDLSSNVATPAGQISQHNGAGSPFRPSPDFRRGFNVSSAMHNEVFVCDLEKKQSKFLKVNGWPMGWWDNQTILLQNQTNDLALYDVLSERTIPLLSATNVIAWLDAHGVNHTGQKPGVFPSWNGREDDFYVTDTHRKWLATNSLLLKLERPDGRLALVDSWFKFEWSDHFDETQRYYAYNGREMGQRSDGVFLRDLKTKTETTLVPPTDAKYMSIPNFYGTSVIYIRSNQLWQINLNGSNNTRLFPPPGR